MTYTYGYLLDAVLARMDLTSSEANELGLLNKIPFYANEGLAQITAAIKPRHKYAEFAVREHNEHVRELQKKYKLDKTDFLDSPFIPDSRLSPLYKQARDEYNLYAHICVPRKMPDDFIGWAENVVYHMPLGSGMAREATTLDYNTYGDDEIMFLIPGLFRVPYEAYWFHFTPETRSTEELDIPMDIMEALPIYVAAQLFKIDDETKSQLLLNEWEIAIARIDDNAAQTSRSFHNGRDW